MKAPIHAVKHYVQMSLTSVLAGVVNVTNIVRAENPSDVNSVFEVIEGAIVKAVWLELWIRTNDTAPGTFVVVVEKRSGIQPGEISAADMAALGTYENKKNVFYSSQGLSNDQDADAQMIYKGWIKIPKSKQRFGLKDRLVINVFAQALEQVFCGLTTYKEYT